MKSYNWFMGIDVSKAKLDITVLQGNESVVYEVIENSAKGLIELAKKLRKLPGFKWEQCLVCAEHTGIYNAHLLAVSQKYKWDLCLESAVQIKQSGGLQRGKNDAIDSYRIALYARKNAGFIKLWQAPRKVIIELQKLSALRSRLIGIRNQLNHVLKEDKGFTDKSILGSISTCSKHTLAGVEKDLKAVVARIDTIIEEDPELKRLFAITESVTGVGRVMALQMVVTSNEFKNIKDPRKYACYSGVAPFEHTSGSSIRGRTRTSKKANQQVKTLLHMCSMVAIQYSPEMTAYFERKVAEGKNKMAVLNGVKNKLIHRVFACVNRNEHYKKEYKNNLALS